nr:hypothetical protein 10 [Desulfobacterales bacterium]
MKTTIVIVDVYTELEDYIRDNGSKLRRFVSERIKPDMRLHRLWRFTFPNGPLKEPDPTYPHQRTTREALRSIQLEDVEYLRDITLLDPANERLYEFLSLRFQPLYFACLRLEEHPELSFEEVLRDMSQEIVVRQFEGDELTSTRRISIAQMPSGSVTHTSRGGQECVCVEFLNKPSIGSIQFIDNYSFRLFNQGVVNREAEDIIWGEGGTEYFITIITPEETKSFPFPIFSKCSKLLSKLSRNMALREKILDSEQECFYTQEETDKYVSDSLRARLVESISEFSGKGSWEGYLKKVLPHSSGFKTASTQTTVQVVECPECNEELDPYHAVCSSCGAELGTLQHKTVKRKRRVLETRLEHSAGSITGGGSVLTRAQTADEDSDADAEMVPDALRDTSMDGLATLIDTIDMISLLDKRDQKAFLLHLEGLNQSEIARELGTSQSRVSRLFSKLRARIISNQ